jgi:hypothetical protein
MAFSATLIDEDFINSSGQTLTLRPTNFADKTAYWLIHAAQEQWQFGNPTGNSLLPDMPNFTNFGTMRAIDTASEQDSGGMILLVIGQSLS